MPQALSDVKRRITTTRQLRKVTSTLQKVAASRLNSSRRQIEQADVYFKRLCQVLSDAYGALPGDASPHPLMSPGRGACRALVVMGADRGLCGAFNTGLINRTAAFVDEHADEPVELLLRGKVVYRRALRRGWPGIRAVKDIDGIVTAAIERFLSGELATVHITYWKYLGGISQKLCFEQLLPTPFSVDAKPHGIDAHMIEPGPEAVIERLLPEYVRRYVHNSFYNSMAAENAARQASMSRASENAGDLIRDLSRRYSRLRQESITTEMLEIIAGAGG